MGVRTSIGITTYRPCDLEPDSLKSLASWRDLSAASPYLLDPDLISELTAYLLDGAEPDARDMRYARTYQKLAMSARIFRSRDGKELAVLSESVESSIRKRLHAFDEEDRAVLHDLDRAFFEAEAYVLEDGTVVSDSTKALEAWARAAEALDAFVGRPRRSGRFGIADMLWGFEGLGATISALELYRRLLLAAGRALNIIGAATLDYHDFGSIDSAVNAWCVARGDAAKRIGAALLRLARNTKGAVAPDGLPAPNIGDAGDGPWIFPHSRLGQLVTEWAMEHGPALNIAAGVGVLWPGPAVYGIDDGEEEPYAACELLEELSRGACGPHGLLYGSDVAVVSNDFKIDVSPRLLRGERRAYVVWCPDESGGYLRCVGESRRISLLAKLIAEEQEQYCGRGARFPNTFSEDFDEWFELLSIRGEIVELDKRGRLPLGNLGLSGLRPGARLVVAGEGETFRIDANDRRRIPAAMAEGADISSLYFGDL